MGKGFCEIQHGAQGFCYPEIGCRREEDEQQGYLTHEQRSRAGWIGALKCEVIFERVLKERTIDDGLVEK